MPQFYMRGFSKSDRVKVVRFGEPASTFISEIKNVAVESNFYDADWVPADRVDELEKLLSRIEGAAAGSLARLLAGDALTPEDRYSISAWVILQFARGRGQRFDSISMQQFMVRAQLALAGKQRGLDMLGLADAVDADEEWERLVVEGQMPEPSSARLQHARTMMGLVTKIAPIYASASWRAVRFNRKKLYTGDNPVSLWSEPRIAESEGPGIGLLTADLVSLPLDRATGLAIFPQVQTGDFAWDEASTQRANAFNLQTWLGAQEFVILHPDDSLPENLPERRPSLGNLAIPDIQQFFDVGEAFRARTVDQNPQ